MSSVGNFNILKCTLRRKAKLYLLHICTFLEKCNLRLSAVLKLALALHLINPDRDTKILNGAKVSPRKGADKGAAALGVPYSAPR